MKERKKEERKKERRKERKNFYMLWKKERKKERKKEIISHPKKERKKDFNIPWKKERKKERILHAWKKERQKESNIHWKRERKKERWRNLHCNFLQLNGFKYSKWLNSSIWSIGWTLTNNISPSQLEIWPMKKFLTFPKTLVLEPHHHIVFLYIRNTRLASTGFTLPQRSTPHILQLEPTGLNSILHD